MAHGGNLVSHVASVGGKTPPVDVALERFLPRGTLVHENELIRAITTATTSWPAGKIALVEVEKAFNTLDVSSRKVHANPPRKA